MPAKRMRVTYAPTDEHPDGRTAEVAVTPKVTVMAERKYGTKGLEETHGVEAGFYMAWCGLGMPGGASGFDPWLESVADMEGIEDPTKADSSPAT